MAKWKGMQLLEEFLGEYSCQNRGGEKLRKRYQVKYCANTFNAAMQLVF